MFPERWCTHRPNIDVPCVSTMPCSFSTKLSNQKETGKLMQVYLVGMGGDNISTEVSSNGLNGLVSGKQFVIMQHPGMCRACSSSDGICLVSNLFFVVLQYLY